MFKAVIFDLDGTIIDSESLAFQVIRDWAQGRGFVVAEADAAVVAGKKWDIAFDHIEAKYRLPVPRSQMASEILELYGERLSQGGLIPVPGVVESIQALSGLTKLGLVSGSFRRDILFALGALGIEKCFEVILGAEDYLNSKPAPDGYLKAMAMLGVSAGETLVFEDSYPGILSGREAGAIVAAVTSTNHFQQAQDLAHVHIKDFLAVTPLWVSTLYENSR